MSINVFSKRKLEVCQAKFIPNIDFIGQGYNILYGNPRSSQGLDEGYKNFRMIKIEYPSDYLQSISIDERYFSPKGVVITLLNSCSLTSNSQRYDSGQKYREFLQTHVSTTIEVPFASFSASKDYKEVKDTSSKQQTTYVESLAQCQFAEVILKKNGSSRPNISQQLIDLLLDLEKSGENEIEYHKFFDKVGTHVISQIRLGSIYGYRFEFRDNQYENLSQSGFNFEGSVGIFSAKLSGSTSQEKTQQEKLNSALTSWKSISIGAVPDKDNDVDEWQKQVIKSPMPVNIKLISMSEFLKYFSKDRNIGIPNLDQLIIRFDRFLITYCLKQNGKSQCQGKDLPYINTQGFSKYLTRLLVSDKGVRLGMRNEVFTQLSNNLVEIRRYRGTSDQNWWFIPIGKGEFIVQNANKMCLTDDKQILKALPCNDQDWRQQITIKHYNIGQSGKDSLSPSVITMEFGVRQSKSELISNYITTNLPGGLYQFGAITLQSSNAYSSPYRRGYPVEVFTSS